MRRRATATSKGTRNRAELTFSAERWHTRPTGYQTATFESTRELNTAHGHLAVLYLLKITQCDHQDDPCLMLLATSRHCSDSALEPLGDIHFKLTVT